MKKLLVICLMLLSAIPLSAQDSASDVFETLEVSNVRFDLSDDNRIVLIIEGAQAVCEPLFTDVTVNGQFIDVNAYVPPSDSVCNTLTPVEERLNLPMLATNQTYVLQINDFATTFYLADQNANQSNEAFAVLWGDERALIPFEAVSSRIEEVQIDGRGDNRRFDVGGTHADGCVAETVTRLRPDDVQSTLYHLEVFRLLPAGVMCPASLESYETSVRFDTVGLANDDIIKVGEQYFAVDGRRLQSVERYDLSLASVDILETAGGNIVVVTGNFTCGNEMTVSVRERRYVSLIDIGTYLAPNASCSSNGTAYEQTFETSVLPVIINGVAYDSDGAIVPDASAQTDDSAPEGNLMPVDTVIESVEVAVLESFPMQLQLTVSGYQPDGCDFPVEIAQTVNGNDVTLHIFRNVPADVMCPMMLNPYNETIMVDGSFEGGTVNIQINDFTTTVDL